MKPRPVSERSRWVPKQSLYERVVKPFVLVIDVSRNEIDTVPVEEHPKGRIVINVND
mgnify:CR=1 FL=1